MSTECFSQNIQIEQILTHARNELQWGKHSDLVKADFFEVWTIREDCEIDRVGSHSEYKSALDAAELLALFLQTGYSGLSPIAGAVVVWVFRNSEEDSVLEVGIAKRKDDGS